jgi:Lar family restriction alleviation protein
MPDQLKPCPFCGGQNVKCDNERDKRGYTVYFGKCFDCGAMGHDTRNYDKATAAWNTRPIEDALRAQLEAATA